MVHTAIPPVRAARLRGAGGREAARACVAARLESLGRPPDLVTDDAIDALVVAAGGSFQRLRAALASALFLGATEEAPRIDGTIVARAVESLPPDVAPAPKARALPGTMLKRGLILALVVETAVIVTPLARLHKDKVEAPPVTSASVAAGEAAPAVKHDAASQPMGRDAAAAASAQGNTGAPARAAPPPLPQAIAVGTPPLPPSAKPLGDTAPPGTAVQPGPAPAQLAMVQSPPAQALSPPPHALTAQRQPVLPEAAPTTIVLRYRAGDRWAFDKLDAVSARLHEAGYARVYSTPWAGRMGPSPVTYFFNEDRYAAVGVEAVIAQAGLFGPASRWRFLAPRLEVSRNSLHPPGTIEATIP